MLRRTRSFLEHVRVRVCLRMFRRSGYRSPPRTLAVEGLLESVAFPACQEVVQHQRSVLGRYDVEENPRTVWMSRSAPSRRPRVPDGMRIYAIGDVHGRADLLNQVFRRIDADLAAAPAPRSIEVLLGDYVDRGPASRDVLDQVIERRGTHEMICLKGNHEIFLTEFLEHPTTLDEWRRYGGLETLMSYGLAPGTKTVDPASLADQFRQALPDGHRAFLADLAPSFACGDFFFVHAGVRPHVPLDRQDAHDLLWIRDDFLLHEEQFEKLVVHGHTPVAVPDIRPNRINIDTGAYATGRLTCLVIERDELVFI